MAGLLGKSFDAVLHKMDVDQIVRKIDVDELANRIDWNRVIEKVNLDQQIDRVNVDRLVDRIDFDRVIERSNLEAIVARSSSGIFLQFVDLIRIRIVSFDLFVHRLARGRCCQLYNNIPASPEQRRIHPLRTSSSATTANANGVGGGVGGGGGGGGGGSTCDSTMSGRTTTNHNHTDNYTPRERAAARIVQVQGGYSGIVSRAASWFLDELVILGTFGLGSLCANGIVRLVKDDRDTDVQLQNALLATTIYLIWGFLYRVLCLWLTRRTLGMLLMGIKLVNRRGRRPRAWQIIVRQLLQPWLGLFVFLGGPALFLAWQRQDGRFLHDLMTGTGCVYSWDTRMAKLRLSAMANEDSVFDDDDFEMEDV